MLVRCISNDIQGPSVEPLLGLELGRSFGVDCRFTELEVGGLYVVYGLQIINGWLQYFVADEVYSRVRYPFAHFAAFFETVDRRLSRTWVLGTRGHALGRSGVLVAFDEWAADAGFYERLVDGGERELRVFQEYKDLMDLEFPSPLFGGLAEALDGDWLLCSDCGDTWESQAVTGMVRCPVCKARLSNPRYGGKA